MEKRKKADERAWIEQIIAETEADFAARQEERAALEKQWELNMQFLIGNQYAEVSSRGEIVERDDAFLWQERRVFNHIAPLVESRAAKFSRVRPKLAVTPLSDDDDEITNARLAGRVVETAFEKADFDAVASEVTRWSEVCGTGFYKIVWDAEAGKKVGVTEDGDIFEGDVRLAAFRPSRSTRTVSMRLPPRCAVSFTRAASPRRRCIASTASASPAATWRSSAAGWEAPPSGTTR